MEAEIRTSGYAQTINMLEIKIKKIADVATIPTRGSNDAAGYDLYSGEPGTIVIPPQSTTVIGTRLAMELPKGTFGAIYARSGLATRNGLRPANCVGVIDSDYRGEIKIALYNDSDIPQEVKLGDRIAQMILQTYLPMNFIEVTELDETIRGENGFGSTGTN